MNKKELFKARKNLEETFKILTFRNNEGVSYSNTLFKIVLPFVPDKYFTKAGLQRLEVEYMNKAQDGDYSAFQKYTVLKFMNKIWNDFTSLQEEIKPHEFINFLLDFTTFSVKDIAEHLNASEDTVLALLNGEISNNEFFEMFDILLKTKYEISSQIKDIHIE